MWGAQELGEVLLGMLNALRLIAQSLFSLEGPICLGKSLGGFPVN